MDAQGDETLGDVVVTRRGATQEWYYKEAGSAGTWCGPHGSAEEAYAEGRAAQARSHDGWWTVQCGYATYQYVVVQVQAETAEEACAKAKDAAEDSDNWSSHDHVGDTFVDGLERGRKDAIGWSSSDGVDVPRKHSEPGLWEQAPEA